MSTIGQQVAEQVTRISTEVSEQTDLITQITEAIVGKGIPSETCTIEFTGNLKYIWITYQDLDGAHYLKTFSDNITIKKNSIITFAAYYQSNYSDEIEFITQDFFSDEEIWVQCYYCTNNGQIEINSHLS